MKKMKLKKVVRRFDVSNIIIKKPLSVFDYPNQHLRNQLYSKRECSYLNRKIKLTKRCETRSKELRRRSAPTPRLFKGAAALIILGYK